jgi:Skp family chaperone for outer membrane proteins
MLPPPLIHQSPVNSHSNHYNEEIIKRSPHAHPHLKAEKEAHQKEVQRLNLMIEDLTAELDVDRIKRAKYESRIEELEVFLGEEEEKNIKYQQRAKEVNKKIANVITESEQFLADLKASITEGNDLKTYLSKLEQKLLLLK